MKSSFKRLTALALCIMLSLSSLSVITVSAEQEQKPSDLIKGDFVYAPHTYMDGDLEDIFYYSDTMFDGSSLEYNPHLATMSMVLASASISSQEIGITYDRKSQNLAALLRDIDFCNFQINEAYTLKPGEQTMGVGIAMKVIGEGEDAYTVLAIVPRSAGYEREWAGNFTVGKAGLHEGFTTGRDIILQFAREYVAENSEEFVGDVKIWTVGYSRGAGVANLLAAHLNDNPSILGSDVVLEKKNIFAYNFGTPANMQYATPEEKQMMEDNYANIYNRYSEYDIVTFVPFKSWNFTYYGKTMEFDVYNAEAKQEMLTFLEKTNKTIYDLYVAENSSADPDNFTPVMLDTSGEGISFVPAKAEYGIPTNQKEFLDQRINYLVDVLVPSREVYVDQGYEYAMQRLTSLYFGMTADQSAQFFQGATHDLPMLAAAYYGYYISDCYMTDPNQWFTAITVVLGALNVIEGYVSVMQNDPTIASTAWFQYASTFIASEQYAQVKAALVSISNTAGATPEEVAAEIQGIKSTIQAFAATMTAKVLGSGISAITMDETEKAEILATMTAPEVTVPLTSFFTYMLLGDEDVEELEVFSPTNKSVTTAVTFVYNAGRYMRSHNNEIILSWLRTEDSYYADETWHVHKYDLYYDNNGHWHECECGDKQEVCAHSFSEWEEMILPEGEQPKIIRRCPCGYEQTQNIEYSEPAGFVDSTAVVIICVVSALLVAGAIVTLIILKKRNIIK